MTLYTKCIYAPPSSDDGLRICITGRLTDSDGNTPVLDWVQGKCFDSWLPVLAPPGKLFWKWHKNQIDWTTFEAGYVAHIRQPHAREHVEFVISFAKARPVTLLCEESTPEYCHRRLLAEECKKIAPELEVIVR